MARRTYLPYYDDAPEVIHQDFQGNPIPRPDPLPEDPDIETKIRYMRAVDAYNDAVKDANSQRWVQAFRKGLKEGVDPGV